MDPFELKPTTVEDGLMDWKTLYPQPYDKNEADPYTKVRIILMTGTEFEANWFSHQFHRHCTDNDLRRELALSRRVEQQQQKQLACLKPIDETQLETTIAYEQLAVDLTAILAQRDPDPYVVKTMDLALLEDFDHLYRYADLLEMEQGVHAERLVGRYTEIMPGRPTISEHRHPYDSVRRYCDFKTAAPITKLDVSIITAAEQQTMNYYMNLGAFYGSDRGRKLYQEIGMIEEQHVTQYGALIDPSCTWLESLLMHEYIECYLYYSCFEDETDRRVKKLWEMNFEKEVAQLHAAAKLLQKYEKKSWQQVIPDGAFPELLNFSEQKEYVRRVLAQTVTQTARREDFVELDTLPDDAPFFRYQDTVNPNSREVPSHRVIRDAIAELGQDYRFEESPNPIPALRSRKKDNITLGRKKGEAG
ncbi:hypothetical protein H8S23_13125 [Anaerofilum sp. BX8]|uniref:Uncharacterized protein n=1 Tax=Anaerofilum hominis TaxID=2763016 RepID=A0A923L234_9FIRM|nr:hypothetical protein [Anaerofilum hominis]MBC5582449.1 hypothetical protein [Anaerofilum hominis]